MNGEQILVGGGTAGLILFLFLVVRELWAEHKRHDAMVLHEKDEALDLVKTLVGPVQQIAETQATQNRTLEKLASRRRAYDGAGVPPDPDRQ